MKYPRWREEGLAAVSGVVGEWWRRWRAPARRFGDFCFRLFLIGGYTWVGIRTEMPIVADYLPIKNVLVCLGTVLLIGKAVYDTLFYDHYRP